MILANVVEKSKMMKVSALKRRMKTLLVASALLAVFICAAGKNRVKPKDDFGDKRT